MKKSILTKLFFFIENVVLMDIGCYHIKLRIYLSQLRYTLFENRDLPIIYGFTYLLSIF